MRRLPARRLLLDLIGVALILPALVVWAVLLPPPLRPPAFLRLWIPLPLLLLPLLLLLLLLEPRPLLRIWIVAMLLLPPHH